MRVNDLIEFQHKNNLDLFLDFDIKKLNWFNIGGKVKIFFKPKNLIELKKFLKIYSNRGKIFVLGSGSNVLFKDNTYDGAVIKLSKSFSKLSRLKEDIIIAGSSCSQKKLSEFAMENQISGFEFMYCIPGSVGGGLKMNSGCFGTEFKDNLVSIQCMDFSGNIKLIPSNKLISDHDVLVLPSKFDGFGFVVSEAINANTYVISFTRACANANYATAIDVQTETNHFTDTHQAGSFRFRTGGNLSTQHFSAIVFGDS